MDSLGSRSPTTDLSRPSVRVRGFEGSRVRTKQSRSQVLTYMYVSYVGYVSTCMYIGRQIHVSTQVVRILDLEIWVADRLATTYVKKKKKKTILPD